MQTEEIMKQEEKEVVVVKEEKTERKWKKVLTKLTIKVLAALLILSVAFIGGVLVGKGPFLKLPKLDKDSAIVDNPVVNVTPDVEVTYLNTALKEAGELVTAKLKINGVVKFKDTGVIILNKSDFVMKYTADISAGIDMTKVKIEEKDIDHEKKKITVRIPKATIGKPNVYHGKKYTEFYDTGFALINIDEKEDLSEAYAHAEDDAKKYAKSCGILKIADKQSKTLIKGILSDIASPLGYTVEVKLIEKEK